MSASVEQTRSDALFLWFTSKSPGFHDLLARRLKERYGWETVLFCNARQAIPGARHFDSDAFVEIIDLDPVVAPTPLAELPPIAELAAELERVERRLGLNFNEIMRADRHLGRAFVKGAWYARSLYGRSANYEQTMDIVLRLVRFFEGHLSRWRPRAILALPGSVAVMTLFQVAHAHGAPWRGFVQSRISTRFFWSDRVDYVPLGFHEALAARLAEPHRSGPPIKLAAPAPAEAYFRGLRERASLKGLLRRWYGTIRHKLPSRLRPGRRNYGNYLILDELWAITRSTFRLRRGLGRNSLMPPLPPGQPYVLFPLQVEPESSIMAESPMANNQLAVIDLLACTLPAGWRLVVKEHPAALEARPFGFYRQIRSYPNVNLAPAMSDADGLADGARCVAVINGTVGVQAAVRGVPVITFHPHFIVRGLPHVWVVDSYETLRRALCRVRDGDVPDRDERIAAGRCVHQTMIDLSFEIDEPRLVLNDRSLDPPSVAALDRIADTLIASLDQPKT